MTRPGRHASTLSCRHGYLMEVRRISKTLPLALRVYFLACVSTSDCEAEKTAEQLKPDAVFVPQQSQQISCHQHCGYIDADGRKDPNRAQHPSPFFRPVQAIKCTRTNMNHC